MPIDIFGVVSDITRLLLTIPDNLSVWLGREANKRGVSIQNRIRAVLNSHSSKRGFDPIFDLKDRAEVWDRVEVIAKRFYDLYAIERQRLEIVGLLDDEGNNLNEKNQIVIPIINKSFFNFVDAGNEVVEGHIEEAVKCLTDEENKILSICDDGETVFEGLPFKCHTWYGIDRRFYGQVRVAINSRRTPTMDDVNRLILKDQSLTEEEK